MPDNLPIPTFPPGSSGDNFYTDSNGVVLGLPENSDFLINYAGEIQIGNVDTSSQIVLNGSIAYEYTEVDDGTNPFVLDANHYFVEITNSLTNTVSLPDVTSSQGRTYIVSKGYAGGLLTIQAFAGQLIDGNSSISLSIEGERIAFINNGLTSWFII